MIWIRLEKYKTRICAWVIVFLHYITFLVSSRLPLAPPPGIVHEYIPFVLPNVTPFEGPLSKIIQKCCCEIQNYNINGMGYHRMSEVTIQINIFDYLEDLGFTRNESRTGLPLSSPLRSRHTSVPPNYSLNGPKAMPKQPETLFSGQNVVSLTLQRQTVTSPYFSKPVTSPYFDKTAEKKQLSQSHTGSETSDVSPKRRTKPKSAAPKPARKRKRSKASSSPSVSGLRLVLRDTHSDRRVPMAIRLLAVKPRLLQGEAFNRKRTTINKLQTSIPISYSLVASGCCNPSEQNNGESGYPCPLPDHGKVAYDGSTVTRCGSMHHYRRH